MIKIKEATNESKYNLKANNKDRMERKPMERRQVHKRKIMTFKGKEDRSKGKYTI